MAEKRLENQLRITSAEYVPASVRVECLKMAYETAHKIGHFKNTSTYTSIDGSFEDDLKEVFEIADKNLDYVLNKHKGNGDGPL